MSNIARGAAKAQVEERGRRRGCAPRPATRSTSRASSTGRTISNRLLPDEPVRAASGSPQPCRRPGGLSVFPGGLAIANAMGDRKPVHRLAAPTHRNRRALVIAGKGRALSIGVHDFIDEAGGSPRPVAAGDRDHHGGRRRRPGSNPADPPGAGAAGRDRAAARARRRAPSFAAISPRSPTIRAASTH